MENIYLRLIIGADYESPELFDHKIKFIKRLGISKVLSLINYKTVDKKNFYVKKLNDAGFKKIFLWPGRFSESEKVRRMEKMIKDLQPNDWVFNSDLDEFPFLSKNPKKFLETVLSSQADVLLGGIIDRFAEDYSLKNKVRTNLSLYEQFPINVNMHKIFPEPKGCIYVKGINECLQPKVVLHRKKIKVSHGYHCAVGEYSKFNKDILVFHFKWFHGVINKLKSEINDVPEARKHFHRNWLKSKKSLEVLEINIPEELYHL